jgi:hypothetical protein
LAKVSQGAGHWAFHLACQVHLAFAFHMRLASCLELHLLALACVACVEFHLVHMILAWMALHLRVAFHLHQRMAFHLGVAFHLHQRMAFHLGVAFHLHQMMAFHLGSLAFHLHQRMAFHLGGQTMQILQLQQTLVRPCSVADDQQIGCLGCLVVAMHGASVLPASLEELRMAALCADLVGESVNLVLSKLVKLSLSQGLCVR